MGVVNDGTEDILSDNRDNAGNRKRKASEVQSNDDVVAIEEEEEISVDEHKTEKKEPSRLQQLIPTVSIKDNVTQLDIILEAIRYIDTLRDKLANREVELLERT